MTPPIRLNLGAGDTQIEGFTPIDRKLGTEAYPLDYPDGSVDQIRASHVLEHFGHQQSRAALRDWVRALKPGGLIRIAVPDFDKIADSRFRVDPKWPLYLMGGQTDDNDYHKSVYNEQSLTALMVHAGLIDIQRWTSENTDCASLPVSLNLQGRKPTIETISMTHNNDSGPQTLPGAGAGDVPGAGAEQVTVKVQAVMTLPRYGSMATRGIIEQALRPFGLGLETSQGVFWGQCMQRLFEKAVDKGIDWILTVDFDSVFTAQHVDRLFGVFGANPGVDALAALQPRRANDRPLMTVGHQNRVETDGSPIKVTTAHFGLTLIRVEDLVQVPKPWFKAQPEDDGQWGDKRLDDDIWFWHQWRLAGKTIYVDPQCCIGHVQEYVQQYDERLEMQLTDIIQWRDRHVAAVSRS